MGLERPGKCGLVGEKGNRQKVSAKCRGGVKQKSVYTTNCGMEKASERRCHLRWALKVEKEFCRKEKG